MTGAVICACDGPPARVGSWHHISLGTHGETSNVEPCAINLTRHLGSDRPGVSVPRRPESALAAVIVLMVALAATGIRAVLVAQVLVPVLPARPLAPHVGVTARLRELPVQALTGRIVVERAPDRPALLSRLHDLTRRQRARPIR